VDNSAPPRVAVIGGGIAGLAAAFFLREEPVSVTVLEGSPRLGGKLAVSPVAGIAVDEGAEALLARRPEGTGLIRAAGLAGQLAAPGTTAARIWSRNQLVPLPRRQVMGVPADLDDLARCRLLSAEGMARAREDLGLPATERGGDVDVASYVGARFARRWSTGWWTRCSPGCTRAGRRTCRSRRPCPAWRRSPAGTRPSPRRRVR
jgi:oxygen-dependent protoporphyrinogen oxidase